MTDAQVKMQTSDAAQKDPERLRLGAEQQRQEPSRSDAGNATAATVSVGDKGDASHPPRSEVAARASTQTKNLEDNVKEDVQVKQSQDQDKGEGENQRHDHNSHEKESPESQESSEIRKNRFFSADVLDPEPEKTKQAGLDDENKVNSTSTSSTSALLSINHIIPPSPLEHIINKRDCKIKFDSNKVPDFSLVDTNGWALIFIAYQHNGMRTELKDLYFTMMRLKWAITDKKLKKIGFKLDYDDIKHFYKWWKFFTDYLVEHHEMEESVVMPWIKSRAKLDNEIHNEHTALFAHLNYITNLQTFVDGIPTEDLFLMIIKACHEFVPFVLAHFAEEEAEFVPLLTQHFSEHECQKVLQKIIDHQQKNKNLNKEGIVLMLDWMTEQQAKDWEKKNLKFSSRFLYKHVWKKQYKQHHAGELQKLIDKVVASENYAAPIHPDIETQDVLRDIARDVKQHEQMIRATT